MVELSTWLPRLCWSQSLVSRCFSSSASCETIEGLKNSWQLWSWFWRKACSAPQCCVFEMLTWELHHCRNGSLVSKPFGLLAFEWTAGFGMVARGGNLQRCRSLEDAGHLKSRLRFCHAHHFGTSMQSSENLRRCARSITISRLRGELEIST